MQQKNFIHALLLFLFITFFARNAIAIDEFTMSVSSTVPDAINNSGILLPFNNTILYGFPFKNCKILSDDGKSISVNVQSANPLVPLLELQLSSGRDTNFTPIDFNMVVTSVKNAGDQPLIGIGILNNAYALIKTWCVTENGNFKFKAHPAISDDDLKAIDRTYIQILDVLQIFHGKKAFVKDDPSFNLAWGDKLTFASDNANVLMQIPTIPSKLCDELKNMVMTVPSLSMQCKKPTGATVTYKVQ